MNRIEDATVAFYLRHRRFIDLWSAAGNRVPQLASEFYRTLQSDLEEQASALGSEVEVHHMTTDVHEQVGLARSSWPRDAAGPLVLCCFEWRGGGATFTDGWRVVGARVDRTRDDGLIRDALEEDSAPVRKTSQFPKSSRWWLGYAQATTPAAGAWWEDLTPIRVALVDSVLGAWDAFHAVIDSRFPRTG